MFTHTLKMPGLVLPRRLAVAAVLLVLVVADAALGSTRQMTVEIGPLGDGEVTFEMGFDARGWQAWKALYGDNPSKLRRDLGQLVSQYAVDDLTIEQDEMDRRLTMHVKARGIADYHGDGEYTVELEKAFGRGERVGDEFRFAYNEQDAPGVVTLVKARVVLPDGASEAEQRSDSNGRPVIAYEVPEPVLLAASDAKLGREPASVEAAGPSWPMVAGGAVLAVLGLALTPMALGRD